MESKSAINLPPQLCGAKTNRIFAALGSDSARFVGGCVRDAILGRPFKDVDIATSHSPPEIMRLLQSGGIKCIPTGIDHGTVTAVVDGASFEITALRRDVATDGRHAVVEFTDDWQLDALRRDFTMNAIYCGMDGEIFDPTGGRADAIAGNVRFVGDPDARICEDYLRILRYFRFYAHYGKIPMDSSAVAACRRHAAMIETLSMERVRDEFLKLLAAKNCVDVLQSMSGEIMRHVIAADKFDLLQNLVNMEKTPDPVRRLGAIILQNRIDSDQIAHRWKLSNEQKNRLINMAKNSDLYSSIADEKNARAIIYKICARDFIDVCHVIAAKGIMNQNQLNDFVQYAETCHIPSLPINGGDVMAIGIGQGSRVGELLAQIENWWIAGDFTATRDECLSRLRQLAGLAQ